MKAVPVISILSRMEAATMSPSALEASWMTKLMSILIMAATYSLSDTRSE